MLCTAAINTSNTTRTQTAFSVVCVARVFLASPGGSASCPVSNQVVRFSLGGLAVFFSGRFVEIPVMWCANKYYTIKQQYLK